MDSVTIAKFLFTASVIVFSSWLSQKRPDLAGFTIALPLASLLALALAHLQHGDAELTNSAHAVFLFKHINLFYRPSFIAVKYLNRSKQICPVQNSAIAVLAGIIDLIMAICPNIFLKTYGYRLFIFGDHRP